MTIDILLIIAYNILRGYEAYQNRFNRGYEACQNRFKKGSFLWLPFFISERKYNMFKWVTISEEYLDFLRENGDSRIPYSNYGDNKFKPFFGVLFTKGELAYVTQVSHPQPRHYRMTESMDFKKIYDKANLARLICVVNLNYMFPVPLKEMEEVKYSEIEKFRSFSGEAERSQYIFLLRKEMQAIRIIDISSDAQKIYTNKYAFPNNPLSKRCLDFKAIEKTAQEWVFKKNNNI